MLLSRDSEAWPQRWRHPLSPPPLVLTLFLTLFLTLTPLRTLDGWSRALGLASTGARRSACLELGRS